MFPNLCNWQRRSVLAVFLVVAIGCGETEVPTASIQGQKATPAAASPDQLLGAWIVGGESEAGGDDIASRMEQGIADVSCRFEFMADNKVNIQQGGESPVQSGQWHVVEGGNALSIQIVAPNEDGSSDSCHFQVVFHDQDHVTVQQTDDAERSFECTRRRLR